MNTAPTMAGTIERRLLVNYRVDAQVRESFLPAPFRPLLVQGWGLAGICMIRLRNLRPAGLPPTLGLTTESAAHRVAVEWEGPAGPCRGVYIPRRDTSSRLTVLFGGRLFPGAHHRAHFQARETRERFEVAFASEDGTAAVSVTAHCAAALPPGSVFGSSDAASTFFENGSLGYSPTRRPGRFEGLTLECATWRIQPLMVEQAESSFFQDGSVFPSGAVEFDSALVMREIHATWRAGRSLPNGRRPVDDRSLNGASIHGQPPSDEGEVATCA
jgi:hypothetical protein